MTPDPGAARLGWRSGLTVAALAALGPVLVLGLDRASALPEVALRPLDLAPACVNQGGPSMLPSVVGRAIVQPVNCGGTVMNIEVEVFSPRSTAAPVNAERRRLTRYPDAEDMSEAPIVTRAGSPLPGWRFIRASDVAFLAAAGLWVNGRPATPGLRMRLSMARTSVSGGAVSPVLVVITPVEDWPKFDMRQRAVLEHQIAGLLETPAIGDQVVMIAKSGR